MEEYSGLLGSKERDGERDKKFVQEQARSAAVFVQNAYEGQ
jgi:hypothetical protein